MSNHLQPLTKEQEEELLDWIIVKNNKGEAPKSDQPSGTERALKLKLRIFDENSMMRQRDSRKANGR